MENTEKFILLDDYLKEKKVKYIRKNKVIRRKKCLIVPSKNMYIDKHTGHIKEITRLVDKSDFIVIHEELIKSRYINDYYEIYSDRKDHNLIKNLEEDPQIFEKLFGVILENGCLFYFTSNSDSEGDYFIYVEEENNFISVIEKSGELYIKDFSSIIKVLELW